MQIAVLTYPAMTALDAIGPYEVLRLAPGVDLRFVWHEPGPVVTDSNVLVLGATHSLEETPAPQVVVVPGGAGAFTTVGDERVLDWLRRVHRTSLWTTSVCTGSLILAAAGLLDGRPATTHWAAQPALGALGATPQRGQRIVHGDRIATAAGVSAGIDLALWLVGEMFGADRAQTIQLSIEYDPQPPFDAGHPSKAPASVRAASLADQARLASGLWDAGLLARTAQALPQALWRSAIRRVRREPVG
ncbi:DJ-1/PfpI family protein [Nocardia transvalensis]|uniref:DJ-1/PfpI family protein n=1 Tax=Nocardia transvalensis TaxID=37333 RepID=UPI001895146E|nr:DJ-1/PfpI family protein [Nocardia transvalensis]MBF6327704.1 DJ-1/PfpI family protein [Nocardia transvalensis]